MAQGAEEGVRGECACGMTGTVPWPVSGITQTLFDSAGQVASLLQTMGSAAVAERTENTSTNAQGEKIHVLDAVEN